MSKKTDSSPLRLQDRLLFWFAAGMAPEAGTFHVESPLAMAQRMELIRRYERLHNAGAANDDREQAAA